MKSADDLFSEANGLKERLLDHKASAVTNEVRSLQQQLQTIYAQLLIFFLEAALEKEVENDLWNIVFRPSITYLQNQARDKKTGGTESQDLLTWFLNSASGFYIQLLNQICAKYSIDLPFRRKDSIYGSILSANLTSDDDVVNKKNALYLTQYCLIHLGDLARYRHQARQAETFYKHAVLVNSSNGHPYNQLGLLEAGRGNRLASVSLYARAICIHAPFSKAQANLIQTLSRFLANRSTAESFPESMHVVRMTKDEYMNSFLLFHAHLLLHGDLEGARSILPRLSSALSTLVAMNVLVKNALLQMVVINIFSLQYFEGKIKIPLVDAEPATTRKEEKMDKLIDPNECTGSLELIEELIVYTLAAMLLPVHTIREPEVLLAYPALPAIRLLFEWVRVERKITSSAMKKKQQIWSGLCSLVNTLQLILVDFSPQSSSDTFVPEDLDLQSFLPLKQMLKPCKVPVNPSPSNIEAQNLLRALRLTELALWFSEQTVDGNPVLKRSEEKVEDSEKVNVLFEAHAHQKPTGEEILALEQLSLKSHPQEGELKVKTGKIGILKPEGSLERMRDEKLSVKVSESTTEIHPPDLDKNMPSHGAPGARFKSPRTNVALQAILKRQSATQESKQVTFKTPSPAVSPNLSEISNDSQRSQLSTPPSMRAPSPHPLHNSASLTNSGPALAPSSSLQDSSGTLSQDLSNMRTRFPIQNAFTNNMPLQQALPPGPWAWRSRPATPMYHQPPVDPSVQNRPSLENFNSMARGSFIDSNFQAQIDKLISSSSSCPGMNSEPAAAAKSPIQFPHSNIHPPNTMYPFGMKNSFMSTSQQSHFQDPQLVSHLHNSSMPNLQWGNIESPSDLSMRDFNQGGNWWPPRKVDDSPGLPASPLMSVHMLQQQQQKQKLQQQFQQQQQQGMMTARDQLSGPTNNLLGLRMPMMSSPVGEFPNLRQTVNERDPNVNTYSLFSTNISTDKQNPSTSYPLFSSLGSHQSNYQDKSLWSGHGPSLLERLLEQKRFSDSSSK